MRPGRFDYYCCRAEGHNTVLVGRERIVVVRDELEAAAPTDFAWSAHTVAEVTLAADHRSAVLSQGGKRCWVGLVSPGNARLELTPLPPEPEPKQVKFPGPRGGAGDYGRMRKLVIRETGVAKTAWTVVFAPLPPNQDTPTSLPAVQALAAW